MTSEDGNLGSLTPVKPMGPSLEEQLAVTPIQSEESLLSEDANDDEFIPSPTDKEPRKSFYYSSTQLQKKDPEKLLMLEELDKIESLITKNLQKIEYNLSKSNTILIDKILPTLESYSSNCNKIHKNVNHIKEFFENAANVNILTRDDIVDHNSNFDEMNKQETNESNMSSENLSIMDRYKQNFSFQSENQLNNNINLNSSINLSFLNNIHINEHDESTGKATKVRTTNDAREGLLINSEFEAVHSNSYEEKEEKTTERIISNENAIEGKRDKYMAELVKGYESPPWEEPPKLESERFISPLKKKRKLNISSNSSVIDSEDEDISIRFPMSPKYGAGGKLLRSQEGRRIALDFARSEMMANHPILSLQTSNINIQEAKDDPTVTGTFYSIESNSTIDNPPHLTPGLISGNAEPNHPKIGDNANQNGDGQEAEEEEMEVPTISILLKTPPPLMSSASDEL